MIGVEHYQEIRQRCLAGESPRHIAKSFHISRNTVKKYCEGNAVPWEHKTRDRSSPVLNEETLVFIKACLEEDEQEGVAKQKHTAKCIYDRLVEEKHFTGGESAVRNAVRAFCSRMRHPCLQS